MRCTCEASWRVPPEAFALLGFGLPVRRALGSYLVYACYLPPGLYQAIAERAFSRYVLVVGTTLMAIGAVNGSFRIGNWITYGAPVGVEYRSTSFTSALGANHSVRSGGIKPYVSVTKAARARIYAVSPAFAELAPYLEGAIGETWGKVACAIPQEAEYACGEIGSVFSWAIRDAAAAAGHHSSPAEASAYDRRVADEKSTSLARTDC